MNPSVNVEWANIIQMFIPCYSFIHMPTISPKLFQNDTCIGSHAGDDSTWEKLATGNGLWNWNSPGEGGAVSSALPCCLWNPNQNSWLLWCHLFSLNCLRSNCRQMCLPDSNFLSFFFFAYKIDWLQTNWILLLREAYWWQQEYWWTFIDISLHHLVQLCFRACLDSTLISIL